MENDFKAGDVVFLKSGSPEMTVGNVNNTTSIECIWFVDSKPVYGSFNKSTLQKV